MKKILFLTLGILLFVRSAYSSPSNTISIPTSFNPQTTAASSEVNSDFNEVQTKFNAHTHTDITSLGTVTTGGWAGTIISKTYGGTGNANGIGLPSGAIFFMISGSCPAGTTDVSTTYANKFVKINATPATSSGTVLTGTSDSHTLATTEIPAHTHDVQTYTGKAAGGSDPDALTKNATGTSNVITSSTGSGGGGGHTHTLSSATTLEPSSITMIACQCN